MRDEELAQFRVVGEAGLAVGDVGPGEGGDFLPLAVVEDRVKRSWDGRQAAGDLLPGGRSRHQERMACLRRWYNRISRSQGCDHVTRPGDPRAALNTALLSLGRPPVT